MSLETSKGKFLKIFSGFQKLRPKISVHQEGTVNAGLELAVDEKEALSALLEGIRHAETLAANKKISEKRQDRHKVRANRRYAQKEYSRRV